MERKVRGWSDKFGKKKVESVRAIGGNLREDGGEKKQEEKRRRISEVREGIWSTKS